MTRDAIRELVDDLDERDLPTAERLLLMALNPVPAFPPDHPGTILREEFLAPAGSPVKGAAERLDVSRQTLHRTLSGKSAVTADMALRLARFTGTSPVFWLNLQAQHDLWHQGRRNP